MNTNAKEERKRDAQTGHIKELKDKGYICDRKSKKDYVFISYSSLNWKEVLHDIVYTTCKKYGLRVYFDTKFDEGSDSWITQFMDNMKSDYCKAVLAFFSPEYDSSYATLMELMASQSTKCGNVIVLPVILGNSVVESIDNTGLGTYRFSDNSTNDLWEKEKELFDIFFNQMVAFGKFSNIEQAKALYHGLSKNSSSSEKAYWEELEFDALLSNESYWKSLGIYTEEEKKKHWESLGEADIGKKNDVFLTKKDNYLLMHLLKDKMDKNNIDGINMDIPEAIKQKLEKSCGSVFDKSLIEPMPELSEPVATVCKESFKTQASTKEIISLKDFVKKYNSKSFKGAALKTIKLIGKGEFARYSSKQEYNSTFHLVWDFVSQIVAERGIQYIEMVKNCSVMDKNPVFVTGNELAQRKMEGLESRYKKLDVNGFEHYYMLRNYDPYNWIALVLKKRMTELGLPLDEFCFEIEMNSDQGVEVLPRNDAKLNDQPEVISNSDNKSNIGGISGPIGIKGNNPGTTVEIVEGKYSLVDFLKEYNNKTFQSKSCKRISLMGVDECEKYSVKGYETARKLVFDFAMKRIDESGMEYIHRVNGYHGEKVMANPIFITVQEHNERKARKESVSYTVVTSKAVSGYSMCTHYSEYDWLKNSLMKQLKALGLPVEKFYLILEN